VPFRLTWNGTRRRAGAFDKGTRDVKRLTVAPVNASARHRLRHMTIVSTGIVEDLAPSGVLRAAINLGNPVMAQGSLDAPRGVTVDIAREIGKRLGVSVEFAGFNAARMAYQSLVAGRSDIGFLAIEPARETEIAFTAPYVVIDGVFVVPRDADYVTDADVDRAGVRIGVKRGSAYDLYLSRTLRYASVVRGDEGIDVFRAEALDVAAGIRQPMTAYVARNLDVRLLEGPFMRIRQAVGTTRTRRPETVQALRAIVEELRANGFVTEALRRSGQSESLVAPAA
jgi:polar amino acid transport system substrate-binding protein